MSAGWAVFWIYWYIITGIVGLAGVALGVWAIFLDRRRRTPNSKVSGAVCMMFGAWLVFLALLNLWPVIR